MTEDEAKTKWCPFVRQLGTLIQPDKPGQRDYVVASGSQNRGYQMGGPLDNCRCIASACMAWRWANDASGLPLYRITPVADMHGHFDNAPMGYCGLAGRP